MRRVFNLLRGLLRELADESASLATHGRTHSAEEWRRFSDARLQAKYMSAKCCYRNTPV